MKALSVFLVLTFPLANKGFFRYFIPYGENVLFLVQNAATAECELANKRRGQGVGFEF